jgi:hypothetical protein
MSPITPITTMTLKIMLQKAGEEELKRYQRKRVDTVKSADKARLNI